MNSDLRIASDLRKAAARLRTHGWRQGGFGSIEYPDSDGPRCMAGAILASDGFNFGSVPIPDFLEPFCEALSMDPGAMYAFNDDPSRIKALSETLELHVPLESVEEGVAARV